MRHNVGEVPSAALQETPFDGNRISMPRVAVGVMAAVSLMGSNEMVQADTAGALQISLETLRQVESRALMITYSQYDGSDFFQEVAQKRKRSKFIPKRFRKKEDS